MIKNKEDLFMKKFLSLLLVACLIFSSLVLLSSCGKKISVKDIEENPIEALSEVAYNTSMFTDELGIGGRPDDHKRRQPLVIRPVEKSRHGRLPVFDLFLQVF